MTGGIRHEHDLEAAVPVRLDILVLRRLSAISPRRALTAIAVEWAVIAGAIVAASTIAAWPVTLLAVVLIGARQHALTVIAHDAAHFRLLPNRFYNEWVGNLLLAWPMFISVAGFRHFHGDHHRYLNRERDGNRVLWGTHGRDGRMTAEWRYPKTWAGLGWKVLRRVLGLTGVYWLLRGLIGGFMFGATPAMHVVRVLMLGGVAAGLTVMAAWPSFVLFWVLPYCTWHVLAQYVRLICEHSSVYSADPRYADTRSTMPGWLGRLFILPRNIGYHLEHHWFPSVPFYRLPQLRAELMKVPEFAANAQSSRSIVTSLAECVR